jgi:hypothetical protein
MTIVVQIREDNKVKEWLSRKIIRITGNTHKVEHFEEVNLATMCKSCCKDGHGAHNCPSPNNPRYGICAGTHHTNNHKYKVRSCQSVKGKRCYDHDILQCINCNGDHTVWNKRLCKVRQQALTKLQKSLYTPEPPSFPKNLFPTDDEILAISNGKLDAIMKTPTMEEYHDEEDHTESNRQQTTPNADEETNAATH